MIPVKQHKSTVRQETERMNKKLRHGLIHNRTLQHFYVSAVHKKNSPESYIRNVASLAIGTCYTPYNSSQEYPVTNAHMESLFDCFPSFWKQPSLCLNWQVHQRLDNLLSTLVTVFLTSGSSFHMTNNITTTCHTIDTVQAYDMSAYNIIKRSPCIKSERFWRSRAGKVDHLGVCSLQRTTTLAPNHSCPGFPCPFKLHFMQLLRCDVQRRLLSWASPMCSRGNTRIYMYRCQYCRVQAM